MNRLKNLIVLAGIAGFASLAQADSGWNGKWDTNYGPVIIKEGATTCGKYKYDKGTLSECKFSGNSLSGKFWDAADKEGGTFQFNLQNNAAFTGSYTTTVKDGETVKGNPMPWNGKRPGL